MKNRSLSRRIAVSFLGLAIFAGVLGGVLAVLFAYTTEDHIFDRLLHLEVEHLQANLVNEHTLPQPELPFARYYREDQLPGDLKSALKAEPQRREVFRENGEHFHLRRLKPRLGNPPIWIVLQVEDYLVVRPVLSDITRMLAVTVLGIIAVAALVGFIIARRVTRPLRSLASEVTNLHPGDLPQNWQNAYADDEAGSLAKALQQAFHRIRDFIDREQRFTQDASHELRTPLAVIESAAEMLTKSPDPKQAKALMERIQAAATSMHLSVDVLLALAREDLTNSDQPSSHVLPIVERTIVNYATLIDDKPIELKVDIDPDWKVIGDPAALQVLIANLISNAFRYTEQGTILIRQETNSVIVEDSGPGIASELKNRVTQAAVKGHHSPGLGLGLSIVERLCERCGWYFSLHSSDNGTIARLDLG